MIDLSAVKSVLVEADALIDALNGVDLDDTESWKQPNAASYGARNTPTKGEVRETRARRSQELQLLATRFELAAALVRNEYWVARGEIDPLNRRRK